ncbi:MAG: DUF6491 family protein [Gammaproteobacteria bacterium]
MKFMTLSALMALCLLTACASAARYEQQQKEKLARYQKYSGEPISEITSYTHDNGWTPVDNEHVVVHVNVNQSYLFTLAPPCNDLQFANVFIGIKTRFPHVVSSGFDSVRAGRYTCRILEIRPMNYKKMQADLAAEKKTRG